MANTRRHVRIAIADDHHLFREALRRLLEGEPGFDIVAEAADGVEALRIACDYQPHVLLLDVAMPRMGGLEALAAAETDRVNVILLTAAIDPPDLMRAVQLGAKGVILKESAPQQLIDGIHRVMDGKFLIGPDVADDLAQALQRTDLSKPLPYGLTAREVEIVEAVASGDSNRDIAARLAISLATVKHHLTNIFDKTGTSTRLELALFALRHGLVMTR